MSALMVEYKILEGTSAKELAERVTSYLPDGWRPLGGVACEYRDGQSAKFYQALIDDKRGDQ